MATNKMPTTTFQGLKVLVADDEDNLAWAIETELRVLGAETKRASTVKQAGELTQNFQPDIAVCDLNFPDGCGLDLLKVWKKDIPTMPVILITGHSAIDSAITALRLGAFDYLQKPFEMQDLIAAVNRAAEVGNLRRRVIQYEGFEKSHEPFTIIGDSLPMRTLQRLIKRIASSKADTVLIYGETGTGKELAARAIHDYSNFAAEPFVEINCASIPETLLESELFGFEKGAFTDAREKKLGLLEVARCGTVFLDEIGEMPLKLQAKLLRVLEYRRFKRLGGTKDIQFSARIVAATNRRLEEEIVDGNFREDLFYRLDIVPLAVPPLRERTEDIPLLVDFLLDRIAVNLGVTKPKISAAALNELTRHSWRGNVRELKNTLQRTIIFHGSKTIDPDTLELRTYDPLGKNASSKANHSREGLAGVRQSPTTSTPGVDFVLPATGICLEDLEKSVFMQALELAKYNQTKAAQLLGLSRHTLRYRLEKFGLLDTNS